MNHRTTRHPAVLDASLDQLACKGCEASAVGIFLTEIEHIIVYAQITDGTRHEAKHSTGSIVGIVGSSQIPDHMLLAFERASETQVAQGSTLRVGVAIVYHTDRAEIGHLGHVQISCQLGIGRTVHARIHDA